MTSANKTSLFLAICYCFIFQISPAQNRANIWYFKDGGGLDFNNNPPTVLSNGAIGFSEGTAAISDTSGSVLFYTEGVTLYDRSHNPMPNGAGLTGNISSAQGALIVPQPESDSLYYVFYPDQTCGPAGLSYAVVDMSLNNGFGDVIPGRKNQLLLFPTPEKVAAVHHCNGVDFWISSLRSATDKMYSWLLTKDGLCMCPVISETGIVKGQAFGSMKFSNNGQWAVVMEDIQGCINTNRGDLYTFDNASGEFAFYQTLGISNTGTSSSGGYYWGASFSPNNQLLYVTTGTGGRYNGPAGSSLGSAVVQFDLNAANVMNSAVIVFDDAPNSSPCWGSIGSVQLAPNGKIYIGGVCSRLDVIHDPDSLGTACNYQRQGVTLNAPAGFGITNFVESYFNNQPPGCTITGEAMCQIIFEESCDSIILANDLPIQTGISCYPNPFSETTHLVIANPPQEGYTIEVIDLTGQLVQEIPQQWGREVELQRKEMATGMYIIRMVAASEQRFLKVLVE